MKLLIITQKVDRTDPILGFFHRWLIEFGKQADQVIVIGQMVGEYQLPPNVKVHSLGKEAGRSKIMQIVGFWRLIRQLRGEYDCVLVHMTPIWVVLGARAWRRMGKLVYLWYEVRRGGTVLEWALRSVRKVFSATESGLPSASSKQVVLGHGIPTDLFCPGGERDPHFLMTVGRVTGIKHFDLILECLAALPPPYHLLIGGGPILPGDQEVLAKLRSKIDTLHLQGRVEIRFMSQEEIAGALQRARLFLHASGGGLDKVVLEAMACGCPVLSAGPASVHVLPPTCIATLDSLVEQTKDMLAMPEAEVRTLSDELRQRVMKNHQLPVLIGRLLNEMEG